MAGLKLRRLTILVLTALWWFGPFERSVPPPSKVMRLPCFSVVKAFQSNITFPGSDIPGLPLQPCGKQDYPLFQEILLQLSQSEFQITFLKNDVDAPSAR